MTFNSLLDAATRLDAADWTKRAWVARAAAHAEQKVFSKFVNDTWGQQLATDDKPQGKGFKDLLRDFGGGF